MTIEQIFEKYNITYSNEKNSKTMKIFKLNRMKVLFWINEGNVFKLNREWYEFLTKETGNYALILVDKNANQYYYMKFDNTVNWFSEGFINSDKQDIYLGKQVLNNKKTLKQIISDLSIMNR